MSESTRKSIRLSGAVVLAAFLSVAAFCAATRPSSYNARVTPLVDAGYYSSVHREITNAEESILCAMYLAKYSPKYPEGLEAKLLEDLAAASVRGVKVTVILDRTPMRNEAGEREKDEKNDLALKFLSARGVDVSFDSDGVTMHSKLIVIDGKTTILGSTNWTYSALRKNHEASVIISSRDVASEFTRAFGRVVRNKEQ